MEENPPPRSPASLRLCHLCDKPFTEESSYNRHVSYCRRAHNRPRRRQKSCRSCSLAKSKCSFQARCTRCVVKGLDCVYDRPPATHKARPTSTAHSSPLLPAWPLSPNADCIAPAPTADAFDFHSDTPTAHVQAMPALQPPATREVATDDDSLSFSNAVRPSLASTPADDGTVGIGPWHASQMLDLVSVPGNLQIPTAPTDDAGFLTRLPIGDPAAQHSATLVVQALRAFPQMMLRKRTFPPFIHAHCYPSPLPNSLAYCMSIAHIFVSIEPETGPYLWQSIQREQQRFLNDASTCAIRMMGMYTFANSHSKMTKMSKEEILAAVQAQLIYIIMRVVVDDAHNSAEINLRMLVTFQILCARFMKLCNEPFCLSEKSAPSSAWYDWVFAESRRRTACVWFLISRVVCVETGIPCDAIESFRLLPLTCAKDLWEARSCDAWVAAYDEYGASTPGSGLDSFGDLMESNKRRKEPAHVRKLDVWNAHADRLGSLLNVAVTMV